MKPTKAQIKQILSGIFPITGDTTTDAVAIVSRKACKTFVEQLENFFNNSEELDKIQKLSENVRELSYANADLEKELKVYVEKSRSLQEKYDEELKANAKLIEKLREKGSISPSELAEAKKRAEAAERKLENRTSYIMAQANDYLKKNSVPEEQRKMFEELRKSREDYELLLKSIKQSERLDRHEYVTRWRILTKGVTRYHEKDEQYALFAKPDGKFTLIPWKNFAAFTGDPKSDDYNQEPFTHYMIIPKTSIRYLLGLGENQEGNPEPETALPSPELCNGCPHHNTNPNNPNLCTLPDCIHNYEKPIGPSSNNTNL